MSDQVEYTDGNYVSLSIEELPYERADENDYHLKFLETDSLDDNVPLLVAPVLLVPKTKRRRRVVKKQKKNTKKNRKNTRSKKRALGQSRLRSASP